MHYLNSTDRRISQQQRTSNENIARYLNEQNELNNHEKLSVGGLTAPRKQSKNSEPYNKFYVPSGHI